MNNLSISKLEYGKVILKLVSLCSSQIAKEEAEMLKPYLNKKDILRVQEETTEARNMLRLYPVFTVYGLRDIRNILNRALKGGILDPYEFLDILDTIQGAAKVKSFLSTIKGDFSLFKEYAGNIYLFKTLEKKIIEIVSPDGIILDTASPTLERIRKNIRDCQERIKTKMDSLIRDVTFQKYLQDNIITIRDGRYVVPVKQEYRANVPGLVHDQSASGATLFIEPIALVELNNNLKRLLQDEEQEVNRILQLLSEDVSARFDELWLTVHALAKIDFLMAKGLLSQQMDAVSPKISDDKSLIIKKGRHPLIKENPVPIDIVLGIDFDILVITGPNTGGKTVTLKTVGLFTLMFMAGLHVPADEGTVLYPFKNIFADIGDEQSIEQSLSTFSSHMKNIIDIIAESNEESLVLLDELGAGTDPTEGAALGMAILDTLQQKKSKVIATTHYSELKAYAYANPRVENASVEFNPETLMPTYKLAIGIPGSSNAFEIALRLGLPVNVIERAKSFLTQEDIKVADLIKNLEENERLAIEERQRILLELEEARAKNLMAEEKLRKIEYEANERVKAAYEEAEDIIKRTRIEAEKIFRDLHTTLLDESRKAQNAALLHAKKSLEEKEKEIKNKLTAIPKLEQNIKVKKGDTVYIRKLNLKAVVLEEPNSQDEVTVQAGIMKISVPIADVSLSEEQMIITKSNINTLSKNKKASINTTLDVRGKTADEALEELDKFIDDAFVAGLPIINVIHGKGTGVLRKAITEKLKTDLRVAEYRLGDFNEGGTGVTVVKLKI